MWVHTPRGGATVGSMGSHDPLEAMEITLKVPWSCWCDPLELLVRPLGAAHHVFDEMSEIRKGLWLQVEEEGMGGQHLLPGLDVAVLENYSCIAENEVYGAGDVTFPIELPVMSHSRYACRFC
ncbi:hypothetical protein DVH24_002187 [Malus domestica]|uniref:Uncharacterized protein n=1 Tax=Malus domestica TaxID=3750 RepID=A0A498I709_MALDO|nr:hypothetical protein DVH24_002187 [Malus domestica]